MAGIQVAEARYQAAIEQEVIDTCDTYFEGLFEIQDRLL